MEKIGCTFIFETHITPYHKFVRILVIEDEQKLAKALRQGLEAEQYNVCVAYTGEEGFYQLHTELFDLVILDVMLPGRSGLEILKTLRERGIHTPVLILTARDTTEDRVRGLDTGADDYLVKPFAFAELLARVRALLRRGAPEVTTKLKAWDLEMDIVGHVVTRSGQALDLTVREFEILEYLLRNQGRVVSREMLSRDVWKEIARHRRGAFNPGDITLRTFLNTAVNSMFPPLNPNCNATTLFLHPIPHFAAVGKVEPGWQPAWRCYPTIRRGWRAARPSACLNSRRRARSGYRAKSSRFPMPSAWLREEDHREGPL